MLTLLLSLIWPIIAADQIGIPYAWVAAVVVPVTGGLVAVFKILSVTQEKRVIELAQVHKDASAMQHEAYLKLSAQLENVWRSMDEGNRILVIRICASQAIAPELKGDAADILARIDKRREKP